MRLFYQRFTCGAVLWLATAVAMAGAAPLTSSAEKARQAIGVLQGDAPEADKAIACKQLAVYGNAEAVPALAPLLCNPKLASWARIALEAIPGRAADDALRDALGLTQGRLLVGVINSIGLRGDTRAVAPLEAKLKDSDVEVATAAAVALGHIGSERAAAVLEKSLVGGPAEVRSAVAQGCVLGAEKLLADNKAGRARELYDAVRKADVPQQRKLEAARGAILARKSDGLPLLLETLRSPDKAMFNIGLHTARELGGRAVTDALAAELGKAAGERQVPLFLALADRTDAGVLPVLLSTAKSSAKNLRLAAIEVLARMGPAAGVPVFLDALSDSDGDVVKAAKAALVNLTGGETDKQLCARLTSATGNTRRTLVELAGQRRIPAAVPELIKAAGDSDLDTRVAGIKALGETVNVSNLGALTDLMVKAKSDVEASPVQDALEAACFRLADKSACAEKLIACLPASSVPAKCALLHVLSVVNTAKALDTVRTAMSNPEPPVRDTAARVLAGWSDAAALPLLMETFRTTQDESHRFLALRGSVRLLEGQPAAQSLKAYTELLSRTERSDDRKVILSGLGAVPDAAAFRLVQPMLADSQVQAEAEMAMLNIAAGIAKSAPAEARAAATKLRDESQRQATRDRATKILSDLDRVRR